MAEPMSDDKSELRQPAGDAVVAGDPPARSEAFLAVRRAEKGDATALPAVRALMARPGLAVGLGGDLAARAAEALTAAYARSNLLVQEAVAKVAADLRADLAGPSPSVVEQLLAERAACCWLHLNYLEHRLATGGAMDVKLGTYYQKAITHAHNRYLSALKALADVRRAAGTVVQVNIARRQVNVAGGTSQ